MVSGDLLGELAAAFIFKDNEVAQKVEQPPLVEDALEQHFQLRHMLRSKLFAFDGAPRSEAFRIGTEAADARLYSVRDDQKFVVPKECRQLLLVCLHLVKGSPDGRLLVDGVFELDQRNGQPVDE